MMQLICDIVSVCLWAAAGGLRPDHGGRGLDLCGGQGRRHRQDGSGCVVSRFSGQRRHHHCHRSGTADQGSVQLPVPGHSGGRRPVRHCPASD